jgi:RNA polymerase sigma-70 factor (ECF subfamily)
MNDERIDAIPTRWSLVRGSFVNGKPETGVEIRRLLVLRYAAAVKRYVGAIVREREDAEELAQEFVLRMMRGDFAGADPQKGRFRDLIKTAIRNMIRNHWEKSNRRRANDAGLEHLIDISDQEQDADWTAAWQKSVLDQTWARMLAQDDGQPSPGYQLLKLRVEFPEASSEDLAAMLSKQTGSPVKADSCRQILRRARIRFAENLLDEIRAGLDDESDERVQEELAGLGLLTWVR